MNKYHKNLIIFVITIVVSSNISCYNQKTETTFVEKPKPEIIKQDDNSTETDKKANKEYALSLIDIVNNDLSKTQMYSNNANAINWNINNDKKYLLNANRLFSSLVNNAQNKDILLVNFSALMGKYIKDKLEMATILAGKKNQTYTDQTTNMYKFELLYNRFEGREEEFLVATEKVKKAYTK